MPTPLLAAARRVASVLSARTAATAVCVVIAPSARPGQLDARLRSPELCDRELVPLPRRGRRKSLLGRCWAGSTGDLSLDEIASPPRFKSWPTWLRWLRELAREQRHEPATADHRCCTKTTSLSGSANHQPLSRSASDESSVVT